MLPKSEDRWRQHRRWERDSRPWCHPRLGRDHGGRTPQYAATRRQYQRDRPAMAARPGSTAPGRRPSPCARSTRERPMPRSLAPIMACGARPAGPPREATLMEPAMSDSEMSREKLVDDFSAVLTEAEDMLKRASAETGDKARDLRSQVETKLLSRQASPAGARRRGGRPREGRRPRHRRLRARQPVAGDRHRRRGRGSPSV